MREDVKKYKEEMEKEIKKGKEKAEKIEKKLEIISDYLEEYFKPKGEDSNSEKVK